MSRSVSLAVLQLRDQAPGMYSSAKSLHCSITYTLSDTTKNTENLALLVAERPSDAMLIIRSFELADGEKYSRIIAVIHSMLARSRSIDVLREIEAGAENEQEIKIVCNTMIRRV